MAQPLIEDLDEATLAALQRLAQLHQTTVQEEAKSLLSHAARAPVSNPWEMAKRIRESLKAPETGFSDSGELLAEGRLER